MVPIAIAIVEQDGQVLIGRRLEGAALAGLWEFPGGKIRAGETPTAAAVRECREETGLEVEVEGLYSTVDHQYDRPGDLPLAVRLHFFHCRLVSHGRLPTPLAPFCWVSVSELGNYAFPAANRQLVAGLIRAASEPAAR